MRTKTIIDGLKNSQKFRVIFKGDGSENDIGMYMSIQQMTEMFATVNARVLCWDALLQLVVCGILLKKMAILFRQVLALLSAVNKFKWT